MTGLGLGVITMVFGVTLLMVMLLVFVAVALPESAMVTAMEYVPEADGCGPGLFRYVCETVLPLVNEVGPSMEPSPQSTVTVCGSAASGSVKVTVKEANEPSFVLGGVKVTADGGVFERLNVSTVLPAPFAAPQAPVGLGYVTVYYLPFWVKGVLSQMGAPPFVSCPLDAPELVTMIQLSLATGAAR